LERPFLPFGQQQKTKAGVMDLLKLVALDNDDVEILSAHLQDALLTAADVHWRPAEKRVVVALNRFDWEGANGKAGLFRRRRAALRFERVTACKCRNCSNCSEGKDQLLNLLAVSFEPADGPAGIVTLLFSGGAALRLEVECLEAELTDLGPTWTTESRPAHTIDGETVQPAK
jgi:Protein of unknown function (DUF2948)